MNEIPRCTNCGEIPPLRRVRSSNARGVISYECRHCGEIYGVVVTDLKETDLFDWSSEAA